MKHLALCAVVVVSCASAPAPSPSVSALRFETKLGAEHPLVGTVYDVRAKKRIALPELLEFLASVQFVLLGEQHNNPDHHALQARIYQTLVEERGQKRPVVFEMFGQDNQAALRAATDVNALGKLFEKRGWEDWRWYAPIAQVALGAGLPIVGGDLSQATLAVLRQSGLGALSPEDMQKLGITYALPEELRGPMGEEMVQAHCGHGKAEQFATMVDAQFARDAALATAVQKAAVGFDGVVLIAGAGHVRTDRGVPWHVRQREAGAISSVAFVEVQDGAPNPDDYARGGESLPYDFVIFTPRASDEDLCARFKQVH